MEEKKKKKEVWEEKEERKENKGNKVRLSQYFIDLWRVRLQSTNNSISLSAIQNNKTLQLKPTNNVLQFAHDSCRKLHEKLEGVHI